MHKDIDTNSKDFVKVDESTGKKYFNNNIPVGSLTAMATPTGIQFKIFPENGTADMWYNGKFVGDRYAVFRKVNGFWQQISNWYCRYGNAVRYMTHKCG